MSQPIAVLVNRHRFFVRAMLAIAIVGGMAMHSVAAPAQAKPAAPTPPVPAAAAADDDDTVDVSGAVRSLPRALFVPADAASTTATKELARLVALTGLFATTVLAPNAPAAGLWVKVTVAPDTGGTRLDVTSTTTKGDPHRRLVIYQDAARALDTARMADAVVADLSGTRSNLSGQILFVDASKVGERRVRVMLGSGEPLRDASPAGLFARGADIGPGSVVYFAAGNQGEMLQIYAEGRKDPVDVKVSGFLQSVAFSPDQTKAAVIAGAFDGGVLWTGRLEGIMKPTALPAGQLAVSPSFGPNGELAWAAGPAAGPLRVYVDGKAISGAGLWASAPSFCPENGKSRIAYMIGGGSSWTTVIADPSGGGAQAVGPGGHPACSADGRTVAVTRPKSGKNAGGVYLIGEDGTASHRIHEGEANGLRWAPGPPLPPEA